MITIIPTIQEKIKQLHEWGREYEIELFIVAVVGFSVSLAFGIGRYSTTNSNKPPVAILGGEEMVASVASGLNGTTTVTAAPPIKLISPRTPAAKGSQTVSVFAPIAGAGEPSAEFPVVGTRSSKKYRLYWCPDAKKISVKNRVLFRTVGEAVNAGYTPVKNCKGM